MQMGMEDILEYRAGHGYGGQFSPIPGLCSETWSIIRIHIFNSKSQKQNLVRLKHKVASETKQYNIAESQLVEAIYNEMNLKLERDDIGLLIMKIGNRDIFFKRNQF